MASKKTKGERRYDVSGDTLVSVSRRALTFLRAVGTARPIRAALLGRGYSSEAHHEGWTYLARLRRILRGIERCGRGGARSS
jgi:hypothetical protein